MSAHQVKEALVRLGIEEEQFRALALVPLVEVAWADGRVDFSERSAIMRFAKKKGWLAEGSDVLVAGWLKTRPGEGFFDDARAALLSILRDRRGLGKAFPEDTPSSILSGCREVAAAAGGLFGLRDPIAVEEDTALQRISDAFELGSWREAVSKADSAVPEGAPGPQGHFLLGSIPEFNRDPLAFMMATMRDHGDVVKVRIGPMTTYFLSHPDGVKHVFMDNHRNYKLPPTFEDLKEFLGDGLFLSEGEHWRRQRRMIQPAFHMEKLAAMADVMTEITAQDLSRWTDAKKPNEPINIMEKLMELTLRVAGVCLFGMDLDADTKVVLDAATIGMEHMIRRSRQLFRLPIGVPIESNRKFVQARATLDEVLLGLVRARREGKTPEKPDVLQLLLDARDEETGEGLSEKELRDELLTMMGAGTETTALALMWTCSFLSQYPTIRRGVLEEIGRALGGRRPTLADVRNMPYTKQVIDESMRLRPPFYIGSRVAVGEDEIGGVKIAPGGVMIASTYSMHRHPEIWPNPEGFDPERFSPEESKGRHPAAFLPFGIGPKKCIGMNFANMEMQLVLPMILQKYELNLVPGMEPEPYPSLTLRAKEGCWMSVREREEAATG